MAGHDGRNGRSIWGHPVAPIMVMAASFLVFICGLTIAVLRDRASDKDRELENASDDLLNTVVSTYGSEGAPLSYALFISSPEMLTSRSEIDGRTGLVTLSPKDLSPSELYFPDKKAFSEADGEHARRSSRQVIIAMGDGRVVPGSVEVFLIE